MDILQGVEELAIDGNQSVSRVGSPGHLDTESPAELSYCLTALTKGNSETNRKLGNYHTVAYFPWTEESLGNATGGKALTDDDHTRWRRVTRQWSNIVAICGFNEVILIRTVPGKPISLLTRKLVHAEELLRALTWVIEPETLNPLLAFGGDGAVIYIWDPSSKVMKGVLRGHGGAVTSLCAHPIYCHILASTSRDRSTRIYDLGLGAYQQVVTLSSPHTSSQPNSLGDRLRMHALASSGAPLGDAVADEGRGIGKCVLVLAGQAVGSGGHEAAVLDAAFHPTLPLIATCGLDRCVKIWFLPSIQESITNAVPRLVVDDKPLFSTSLLHECRVTSVKWFSKDVLLSKSSEDSLGTMVLWKWFALERFFPESMDEPPSNIPKRKADYEESHSFTVLASFPVHSSKQDDFKMTVYMGSRTMSPLFALPAKTNDVNIWDIQRSLTPPNAATLQLIQRRVGSSMNDRPSEDEEDSQDGNLHSHRSKRRRFSPTISEIDYSRGEGIDPTTLNEPSIMLSIDDRLRMMSAESEETWTDAHLKHHWLRSVAFSPQEADSIVAVGDGGIIAVWTKINTV